jgi:hypothetical protein
MDPVICCLLGICCPPFSAEQLDKLTGLLAGRYRLSDAHARAMATDLIDGLRPVIELLQPLIAAAKKHV